MSQQFIEMGFCTKPHGIKGAFLFQLYNMDDSQLKVSSKILLKPNAQVSSLSPEGEEFEIQSISFGNKVICTLKGVDDRNIVEKMIPFKIFYARENFKKLSADEFYFSDLIGFDVVDEERNLIGKFDSFYENGAQAIFVFKKNSGEVIELPYVKIFFPEIDLSKKQIVFIEPEIL